MTNPTGIAQFIAIVEPLGQWVVPTAEQHRQGFAGDGLSQGDRARVLALPGLTGLDIRIRPGAAEVARDCVRAGKPYRLHSWIGSHDGTRATYTPAKARAEADALTTQAQLIATSAGAAPESFGANAEKAVFDHNPIGIDALDAFALEWKARTTTPLDYLGFPLPAWHYGRVDWDHDGDLDTVIPAPVQAHFRRVLCMAYQDTAPQIGATLSRCRAAWPTLPIGAYVSIGAIGSEGRVIGRPEAILEVAQTRPGGIDELTHYLGLPEFWRRMLLLGNGKVRPLVERIPEIAAAANGSAS